MQLPGNSSRFLVLGGIGLAACCAVTVTAVALGASAGLAIALALVVALLIALCDAKVHAHATSHRAEEETRLRGERLQYFVQRLMDVIPEPVYVKDADGYYLLVNQAFCQQRGQPPREILGRSVRELVPNDPTRVESVTREDNLVIQGHRVFKEEIFHRPTTGEARNRIISKGSCLDANGRPVIVGTNVDITDWRRAESKLQAALETQARFGAFLQTVFDALPGALYVKDDQHRFLLVNQALGAALGISAAELTGKRAHDLLPAAAAARLESCEMRLLGLANGVVGEEEIVLQDSAGVARTHAVRIVASNDPQGRRVLIGIHTDITAQRAFDAEVREHHARLKHLVREQTASLLLAKEAAERSSESKSQFMANITHELRTPMHAILSFARIGLARAESGDSRRFPDYFSRIVSSGERMLELVNNLLDLAKLEAGQMRLELRPVNLRQMVDEILHEFEALLLAKHMTLNFHCSTAMPVLGDPTRLGQVVRNLLANALQFSPDGGEVTLRLRETCLTAGKRSDDTFSIPAVEFAIADQGPGVPPEDLEHIFEKFFQSKATASGAGGTGLGLAICREIALSHRGQIFARNREGAGAEFVLRLPSSDFAVAGAPVSL